MKDREILIWLSRTLIYSDNILKIYNHYDKLTDFWNASNDEINNLDYFTKSMKNKLINSRRNFDRNEFDEFINKYEIITILDENYPNKLKEIDEPAMVLYTKGLPLKTDNISIGMVGSRKYTDYGKWCALKFSRELANIGVTIVSGLALGIDGFSHMGALENNSYTIGVLGCGIDLVYPRRNAKIFKEMEKYGTIISEFPPDTEAIPRNFPIRNRIISALSHGLIVVEAKERSGTLITVNYALEQGKTIFSIPGNINSIFSSGTNKLIRDGAVPLLDISDILNEFPILKENIYEKEIEENENLSDVEKLILNSMKDEPMHIDNLVYKLEIDVSSLMTLLIGLELKGHIEEISTNTYTLIGGI